MTFYRNLVISITVGHRLRRRNPPHIGDGANVSVLVEQFTISMGHGTRLANRDQPGRLQVA
jgi:hypothetical protein